MGRQPSSSAAWAFALLAILSLVACGGGDTTPPPDDGAGGGDLADAVGAVPVQACVESWAQGFQSDGCALADGGAPPVDPEFWPDVCTPGGVGWTPSQSSFDQLSWRSFFRASWPAKVEGEPDASKALGVQEGGVFQPTVWEKYANAADLFGQGSASLTAEDYGSPSAVPDGCDADGPRVLSMTSKFPHTSIRAVGAALDSGDESLQSIDQAFRGPLYPQGPGGPLYPVYYEIRINDVAYVAIVNAGAQNKSPDELNCTGSYAGDGCVPFTFPLESSEVKAAWKVLSDDEVASGRFFYQDLQIEDPNSGACLVKPMGLVGLHIARKVQLANADSRKHSWAWATFEQVDNVPPVGSDGSGGTYSFFDPDCQPVVDAATCSAVQTPNPDPAYQCCENLYRYAAGTVPTDPTPDQVTRLDEAPDQTQACNAVYDPLDKGVFDHYNLVVTQWPKANDDGSGYIVTPTQARNTVLETYFTEWDGDTQVNTSSCMGCHSGNQAVDMSYLFLGNTG